MKKLFISLMLLLLMSMSAIAQVTVDFSSVSNTFTVNEGATLSINVTDYTNATLVNGIISYTKDTSSVGTLIGEMYSFSPDFTENGSYDVTFTVDDSDAVPSNQVVTINVNNVNRLPVLGAIGAKSGIVGTAIAFNVVATDADVDAVLGYSVTGLTGATIDAVTGAFSWTPGVAGTYSATFTVADDYGAIDTEVVTFTIASSLITVSTQLLGGSNQGRSYDDVIRTVTANVVITNHGTTAISGASVADTVSDSRFNFSVSQISGISIPPNGGFVTLTMTATVPEDLDAVDSRGRILENNIGTLTVSSSAGVVATTVYMQAENNLRIRDAEFFFDSDSDSFDDGDTIKDVRPNDDIRVVFELENEFSDSGDEDFDIEDAYVNVLIEDNDWDVDEDTNEENIKADDRESDFEVEFDVDQDADGTYVMEISATGEDENGALHGEYWEVDVEVDKPSEEVSISKVEFSDRTIYCDLSRDTELEVEIENTGKKDLDDIVVLVQSTGLKYREYFELDTLDESDDARYTFRLRNIPESTTDKSFVFTITSYFDNDEESDSKYITLDVEGCLDNDNAGSTNTGSTTVNGGTNSNNGATNGNTNTPAVVTTPVFAQTVQDTTEETPLLEIILLVLGIILVLVFIALLIVSMARSRD